jgi:uncharacterized protein (DUF1800 family)
MLALLLLPGAACGMSYDEARHLLARTGFGGTSVQIEALRRLPYTEGVTQLLHDTHGAALTSPPTWVNEPLPDFRRLRSMSEAQRKRFRQQLREQRIELKTWWYGEMIATPSSVTERMTVFWHNHFTSSLRKVKRPTLLYRQNVLLRRHALGNFRDLLHAIAKDPAMVLYLDNQTNRKKKPNENFARELLELFTLGKGHYSERDIKEAARAFTGWMVDRRTGQFRFNSRQHDNGTKYFLNRRGLFDGDDILDIILEQPEVAVFITAKLWREFISDTPNQRELTRLAAIFRDSNYQIKPLLRALLLSPYFRAPENRGTLIKSPVELIVGTARLFDVRPNEPRRLAALGRNLGQDLFDPPNVKGWPGGAAWITTSTLATRQQFLGRLLRGREMSQQQGARSVQLNMRNQQEMLSTAGLPAGLNSKQLERLVLPFPPVQPVPDDLDLRARISYLVLDPVYQLK